MGKIPIGTTKCKKKIQKKKNLYLLVVEDPLDEVVDGAVVEVVGEEVQHGGGADVELAVQQVLVKHKVRVVLKQLLHTQTGGASCQHAGKGGGTHRSLVLTPSQPQRSSQDDRK